MKPPSEFLFKPTLLINTERDSIPYHQIIDMQNALHAKGILEPAFKLITIRYSSGHAFEYWDDYDTEPPQKLIKDEVLDYLKPVIGPF